MKIVFVDDSNIVLKTLKDLVLEMIESKMIECEFMNNSVDVKKMIDNETLEYDLLFVDINMPDVTGYDLAKSAKKISKYKNKKIIAITVEFKPEARELGKAVGIDDWFVKSIVQDSMQSSINNAIKELYEE